MTDKSKEKPGAESLYLRACLLRTRLELAKVQLELDNTELAQDTIDRAIKGLDFLDDDIDCTA